MTDPIDRGHPESPEGLQFQQPCQRTLGVTSRAQARKSIESQLENGLRLCGRQMIFAVDQAVVSLRGHRACRQNHRALKHGATSPGSRQQPPIGLAHPPRWAMFLSAQ